LLRYREFFSREQSESYAFASLKALVKHEVLFFLACFFLDIFDFDKEKCRLKMSNTFSKTRHFSQRNYQNQNQKYRIFIASKYLSNIFSLSYDIEGNLIKQKSIYQQS